MPFNRSVPVVLLLSFFSALGGTYGCRAIQAGERLHERCLPGSSRDDDSDQRVDCADPDCYAFAECGGGAEGGVRPQTRGGSETTSYWLQLLSLRVAREDQLGCFDLCPSLPGRCPCLPDPYIHMFIVGDGTERLVWRTLPVVDTLTATFEDASLTLELTPDERLALRVFDDDEPDEDDFMFECEFALPNSEPQELTCSRPAADPLADLGYEIRLLSGLADLAPGR